MSVAHKLVAGAAAAIVGGVIVVTPALRDAIQRHEGTRLQVYADVGGIPTVCDGVVVRGVPIGTKYTPEQCAELTAAAIERHGRGVLACTHGKTGVQLKQHEYEALSSLAYNVGTSAVCDTCLPDRECLGDLVRAGRMAEACKRILEYGKVRFSQASIRRIEGAAAAERAGPKGALKRCDDRRWQCYGVWLRRKAESDLCMGAA